ncbi:MAG: hypothetical protein L3J12_04465, partial [Spirochaetales bacterium]|nr:hypothetical protein [Spirochaetales bacterium]
ILRQDSFERKDFGKYESLFTLANGRLGLRGNLEEADSNYESGTYLNGFYETFPIKYGESAYGYAKNNQAIVNIADGKGLQIYADGELFTTDKALNHYRELNIRNGTLTRKYTWKTKSGAKLDVKLERIVSFIQDSTAIQILEIEVSGKKVEIEIISSLSNFSNSFNSGETPGVDDPRAGRSSEVKVLKREEVLADASRGYCIQQTISSNLTLFSGMDHSFPDNYSPLIRNTISEDTISINLKFEDVEGKFTFTKYLSYHHDSCKFKNNLKLNGLGDLDSCVRKGASFFITKQKEFLEDFWNRSDLEIKGDEDLQFGIRFNIFHLLQSTGRNGKVSIAAKGLTGSGYEGHFFWDTEIYVLPYFIYTFPEIAKSLLSYRYSIIDKARLRAQELSHKGVLFPWRTINGEEASAYYPAGTAQYHINADIAFGINQYIKSTGDRDFLINFGLEMFIETARFWYDLGEFIPSMDGAFCIHEVTGPDEYTALVNNNLYTNIMARDNLLTTCSYLEDLGNTDPDLFRYFEKKFNLSKEEILNWNRAAGMMRIPYDSDLSLYAQDDAFLNRPVWDFDGVPEDKYPLLLNFHPLTIYRYQVIKQADVVMALFLQGNHFSLSDKKRNFVYYEALTTGDSSLSASIQGIIGMELGYLDLGTKYFKQTVLIDIDDLNGNVKDGVHTAAMAGSWMMVVFGFAGMRDSGGVLSFSPRLPGSLGGVSFKIKYNSCIFLVEISSGEVLYTLLEGQELSFFNYYDRVQLISGKPVRMPLLPQLRVVFIDSGIHIGKSLLFDIKSAGLIYKVLNPKSCDVPPPDPELFLNEAESLKVRRWDCLCLTNSPLSVRALESVEIPYMRIEKEAELRIAKIKSIYEKFLQKWNIGIKY